MFNLIFLLKPLKAAIGTAELIVLTMIQKGLSEEDARSKIWLVDSKVITFLFN